MQTSYDLYVDAYVLMNRPMFVEMLNFLLTLIKKP